MKRDKIISLWLTEEELAMLDDIVQAYDEIENRSQCVRLLVRQTFDAMQAQTETSELIKAAIRLI